MKLGMMFSFIAGGAVGTAVSYVFLKKKFDNELAKEVSNYKKALKERELIKEYKTETVDIPKNVVITNKPEKNNAKVEQDSIDYDNLTSSLQYNKVDYTKFAEKPVIGDVDIPEKPYKDPEVTWETISPDEFYFPKKQYKNLIMTYFVKDDIFLDAGNGRVNNGKELVPEEAFSSVGMFEQDCTYIRNFVYGVDIQVFIEEEYSVDEYLERNT